MNSILFTSSGKRTSLMSAFRSALAVHPAYTSAQLIALDASPFAPTLHLSDKAILGPLLQESGYVDFVLDVCRREGVCAVIPCIDPDIPLLAGLRELFRAEGVTLVVSEREVVEICNDKLLTYSFFRDAGFGVAPFYVNRDAVPNDRYPLFIKPRCGSASAHTYRIHDVEELDFFWRRVPEPIVQDLVDAPEITIDALLDLEGWPVAAVPRIRLQAIGGESIRGITIGGSELLEWIRRILIYLGKAGARGPVTLQAFLTEPEPTMSEVNLRFGGGAPLAFAAGADFPLWLLKMLQNEQVDNVYGKYRVGLAMTRYYSEAFFEPNK